MKKLNLFGSACLLALSATATQASTVFTDSYAPNGVDGITLCTPGGAPCGSNPVSDTWTFDLTADGFDPATQNILSGTVTLNLLDDTDPGGGGGGGGGGPTAGPVTVEFAQLTTGGVASDLFQVFDGATTLDVLSLVTLNQDGTLEVTLEATTGDFIFVDATLNAVEDHAAVPVPAAVWLFGSGLLGLVGVARRRKV